MPKPTLLLTRPAASAVRFAARLDPVIASRAELVISPLLEIVPVDGIIDIDESTRVILTSVNGVTHAPDGMNRSAYCVGVQTALAAKARGWQVKLQEQDADALVAALVRRRVKGPLLHLSGAHQRGEIAERLSGAGISCARHVIYDQRRLPLSEAAHSVLAAGGDVVLPLFSPRTAAQFVAEARDVSHVHAIAISSAVAKELAGKPFAEVGTVEAPTGVEMVRAVELRLSRDRLA